MINRGLSLGPRTQAGLVLALVAALGALLGVLGDRLIAQQRAPSEVLQPPRPDGPPRGPGGPRYGDLLAERLDLSASQRITIDSILAEEQVRVRALNREFQPQFRGIAIDTRRRVEAVLTPEQRDMMRTMRRERMRRLGDERPQFRDGLRPEPDDPPDGRRRPPPDSAPL